MKKLMVLALAAMLAMAFAPQSAVAGKKKKPKVVQEVDGSIALPAPYTDDTGCYAGLHRRGSILTMGNSSGAIGHEFDVDPASWNKPFAMEITGGEGTVDLDIYFYAAFGTAEQVATDPLNAGSPYSVSFNNRDSVGEAGVVPPDMTKVIVCMMAGGADATYHYSAGDGVKLP